MLIIGCDYHPGFQQIAWVDTETGESGERRLTHPEEAEQFYRELKQQNRDGDVTPTARRKSRLRRSAMGGQRKACHDAG